jgi:hypothetical protein
MIFMPPAVFVMGDLFFEPTETKRGAVSRRGAYAFLGKETLNGNMAPTCKKQVQIKHQHTAQPRGA